MGRAHEVRAASMAKTAAKKSATNAKYAVAIYRAAKSGVPDPAMNLALRQEIDKAKKAQVPTDVIKRQIEKASGSGAAAYEEVRYEGFGPNNSQFIIEALTDNVNRTYTAIKTAFGKTGNKLGVSGSVAFNFDYEALFKFEGSADEAMEFLLENDADVTDVSENDGIVTVIAPSDAYLKISGLFAEKKPELELIEDGVTYVPKVTVELTDDKDIDHYQRLMTSLRENEDVQEVHNNVSNADDLESDEEE